MLSVNPIGQKEFNYMNLKEIVCLNKNIDYPYQGIFWVIDNEFICFMDKVDMRDFHDTDLLHVEVWKHIRNQYKVNGKIASYDYFPRGRVRVLPVYRYSDNNKFSYYDCTVYLDKCIETDEIKKFIEDRFNLYLNSCRVTYEGQVGLDGSHYTCHNCKESE